VIYWFIDCSSTGV